MTTTWMRPLRRLLLAALLAHNAHGAALAAGQSAPVAARAPAPSSAGGTVVVSGARGPDALGRIVDPTTSVLLSGRHASSCAFMGPYNPAFDPVSVAYMREFAAPDSISRDVVSLTEYAPLGDVSNAPLPASLGRTPGLRGRSLGLGVTRGGLSGLSGGCGESDLRLAAGRLHIARNDKSLAQAFAAFGRKDYPQALALFHTAWDKIGYHAAGLMLGQMHLYGLGTPRDGKQAVYWLDRVAGDRFDPSRQRLRFDPAHPHMMSEQIQAALMLAQILERGIGVPADPAAARRWYEKAADFGYVPARDILGRGWIAGSFGSKSERKGLGYLKNAAQAGYAPSQYALGKLYYAGADGVARDIRQAGAYFEAAARAGHPGALFAAGRLYDLGVGVPADQSKAIVYYKEAALKGDRDAEFALGTYFYEGGLMNKDAKVARGWFDAAARQGQPDAMASLGAMLSKGEGGPADLAMAYVWLSLANSAGNGDAARAVEAIGPQLSAEDRTRADKVLKPAPRS